MLVKPFVDKGLGNSSYLIASEESGLAAVLDPERDVDRYLQWAEGQGLRLVYTLDTHLHNDFVSGSRELAAQAGVQIVASAEAELEFAHLPVRDTDVIQLGELAIRVIATPGHTPEHISFSILESGKKTPAALFSGGALMVGGAARTDLLGADRAVPLARDLYHSIHDKLLDYPDEVTLYPTHGAGSFCAVPVSAERTSTIGREKLSNPLAQPLDEETFVTRALNGLPSYPTYFKYLRAINQRGALLLGGVPVLKGLSPDEAQRQTGQGAVFLDVRPPKEFMSGHIPGAYGIPLNAPLITWAGWVIPFGTPLVLVSGDAQELDAAVRRLIRIGYDDLRGYLVDGIEAWEADGRPVSRAPVMPVQELMEQIEKRKAPTILDVRSQAEWQAGHLPHAVHIEAGALASGELPFSKEEPKVVHCAHGDRSTVGISVLERRGYRNLILLEDGFNAWQAAGLPIVTE